MSAPRIRPALIGFLLLAAAATVGATAGAPGGATMTREERVAFLQTARVVSSHDIGKGITRPVRVTLSDGTTTHDAGFSAVDEHEAIMRFQGGRTELDFVDSYKYTVAAYGLAVLLGIDDMMSVTVERELDHHKGSLTWWVDDVKYDEGQRLKLKLSAPDAESWNRQMFRMRLFTQLVADEDRNTGNVLITSDWKLWMIDFTRAFRRSKQLIAPGDVTRSDRQLLETLTGTLACGLNLRVRDDSDALGQMPMGGMNGKRWRTELYVQAYNLLNHTNPINFTGVQTSPFYGQATSALPARRIESGLRFSF